MIVQEKIIWQYWENSPEYPNGIPYIKLCHESVDLHSANGNNYKVIRLNEETIFNYLSIDEINPLVFKIKGNENQIAQRVDYYRAKLLCKYGGIWLDSDAIALRNFDYIFDQLKIYEFYGYYSDSINVWAFACNKNVPIMKAWCENNENELEINNEISKGELGHRSLNKFLNIGNNFFQNIVSDTYHAFFSTWKILFYTNKDEIKHFLNIDYFPFIILYNTLIDKEFKLMSKEDLNKKENLLSFLFIQAGVL